MKSALYDIAAPETDDFGSLAERAERTGDHELAEFFRRVGRERAAEAEEAERLLATRVAE